MKKYVNGKYFDITEEEFNEIKAKFFPTNLELTAEERLEKLEKLFNRIKELLEKMGVKV